MKSSFVILCSFLTGCAFALSSCAERIDGSLRANEPPTTRVWVDSVGSALTSRVRIRWSADDPDGFVRGYFVTVGSGWTFTTSDDSVISIALEGADSIIAEFRVAAVDAESNDVWDADVRAGSESLGPEPFVDADNNLTYTPGEEFIDVGLADPTPARLSLRIKNTAPIVAFAGLTSIPAFTLPAASFLLQAMDLDGNETITRFRISLNEPDTSKLGWIDLPGSTTLFTLRGNVEQTSDTISARVLLTSAMSDLGIDLPGMRLDDANVLYAYCEDLAGAKSAIIRMPDTSATWYVRSTSSTRRLLLVNDYGSANPDPESVYGAALGAAKDGEGMPYSDYDVLNLISQPIPAPIHKTMLIASLSMYKSVLWFAKIANLNYAQNALPEYLASGGKVLFTTGFQNFIDPQGLPIDFMPIDSLVTSYTDSSGTTRFGFIPRVYLNSRVVSTDTLDYPTLVFDRTAIFGSYAVVESPNQRVIHRLDAPKNPPNTQELWVGTPAVGIRSSSGNIIVLTIPLHLTNAGIPNRLVQFFEKVFRDDFGI